MDPDQPDVDPPGDQRLQRRIARRLVEAVQTPVLQIGDARREADAEQMADRKQVPSDLAPKCAKTTKVGAS